MLSKSKRDERCMNLSLFTGYKIKYQMFQMLPPPISIRWLGGMIVTGHSTEPLEPGTGSRMVFVSCPGPACLASCSALSAT